MISLNYEETTHFLITPRQPVFGNVERGKLRPYLQSPCELSRDTDTCNSICPGDEVSFVDDLLNG